MNRLKFYSGIYDWVIMLCALFEVYSLPGVYSVKLTEELGSYFAIYIVASNVMATLKCNHYDYITNENFIINYNYDCK